MNNYKIALLTTIASILFLTGCSPKIGSKAWCESMNEKAKSDWTTNEAGEYTKSCVFKIEE